MKVWWDKYSLLLENEPTSIYSHLTRNKKWKLWVGWHGSSCWLLWLCALCFVFCAASKTIRCSWVSPYFILTSIYSHLTRKEKWKLWVGWHGSSCWLLCLCVLCFVFCAASKTIRCSPYFRKWKLWAMFFGGFLRRSNYDRKKLWPEKKVQLSGRRLE